MKSLKDFITESQSLSVEELWDIFASITPEDYAKKKRIKGTENVYKSVLKLWDNGEFTKAGFKQTGKRVLWEGSGKTLLLVWLNKTPYECYFMRADVKGEVEGPFIILKKDKNIYAKNHYLREKLFESDDWRIYEAPEELGKKIFSFV